MPFTQISLKKGTTQSFRSALMEEIYLAMRESIGIPEDDRFATITELEPGNFNSSGNYACLLYTSPSPRDQRGSRMPSSA